LDRQAAITRKLDYISRQLGQIEIVQQLPSTALELSQLKNRSMDVISASLNFLTAKKEDIIR
jgi:hypothetical protein